MIKILIQICNLIKVRFEIKNAEKFSFKCFCSGRQDKFFIMKVFKRRRGYSCDFRNHNMR